MNSTPKPTQPLSRPLVIIESPYAGDSETTYTNVTYARRCLYHSIQRGEAPFASHLLYTQPGVLGDLVLAERAIGIACGYAWGSVATLHAFYTDRGWSPGMLIAHERALLANYKIEFRALYSDPKGPRSL